MDTVESKVSERDYHTGVNIDDWFLMDNIYNLAVILGVYLLLIYKILPSYMKNRPAYQFKKFLVLYNIGQVLACYWVVRTIDSTNVNVLNMWDCFLYKENSPEEKIFIKVSYFIFWLKTVELIETILFVLRKKQNQVSFLHVYHHCSTVILAYVLAKYVRGGPEMFSVYLNSWVHIIMYTYYLVALLGQDIQKKLIFVKKSITIIQMLQFCVLIGQAVVFMIRGCNVPIAITGYYVFVVATIFYLFYDFYKKSYNKSSSVKNTNKSVKIQ